MSVITDHLKTLHTSAIDARNGYQEALKDADATSMTALFRDMIALHDGHASELAGLVEAAGIKPDPDGSFMSTVHRTIMDIRSLFSGLDKSVLPGLIDGEKRNLKKYDEALKEPEAKSQEVPLERQRGALQAKITEMEAARTGA